MSKKLYSPEDIQQLRIAFRDFLLERNLTLQKVALILDVSRGTIRAA